MEQCPFCGSTNVEERELEDDFYLDDDEADLSYNDYLYTYYCYNCGEEF